MSTCNGARCAHTGSHTHRWLRTRRCTHTGAQAQVRTRTCARTGVHAQVCMHTCARTAAQPHRHRCARTGVHAQVRTRRCPRAAAHAHVRTHRCACTGVHAQVRMHRCACTGAHAQVHSHTHRRRNGATYTAPIRSAIVSEIPNKTVSERIASIVGSKRSRRGPCLISYIIQDDSKNEVEAKSESNNGTHLNFCTCREVHALAFFFGVYGRVALFAFFCFALLEREHIIHTRFIRYNDYFLLSGVQCIFVFRTKRKYFREGP